MTNPPEITDHPRKEDIAALLNRACACATTDAAALRRDLAQELALPGLDTSHANLFAATPVFVDQRDVARMRAIIGAIEQVVALPAYRDHVLAGAPTIARFIPGARGVFLGYDFHLSTTGPRLIEINTNAGGAMLNTKLVAAQEACCDIASGLAQTAPAMEQAFVATFRREWQLQRANAPLARIAIVDDAPAAQYLYPEFVLFQRLFATHGIDAVIADAKDLAFHGGLLWHGDTTIDLVYNRLTDFALARPEHAALREAYLADRVVLTPHPRAHALYADKRNLAALTDTARLAAWNVPDAVIATLLAGIPRTFSVDARDTHLWGERRRLFFKPAAGFGSKAAYRGDKLTQRVFQEILAGGYVAQELVAPSERHLGKAALSGYKLDLRNYVYNGEVQLLAARLYQGQTTNFRTQGGGFAPVYVTP